MPKKNKYEIIWALKHPFASLKIKQIYLTSKSIYHVQENKLLLDSFESGGKLDAFRHVFFMAAFTQKIKVKKIRKLGVAHEKGNKRNHSKNRKEHGILPDSTDTVMDLYNNELGFSIGNANKEMSFVELKKVSIDSINSGKALITKRNNKGNYIDCSNVVLSETELRKWNNKKCLVPSNE